MPPNVEELRARFETAQIRCKAHAYLLSKVSRQAHSYKASNHNSTMGMMGSLLRQVPGVAHGRRHPVWEVVAEHAAYAHLVAFTDIKGVAERYIRREDQDPDEPLAEDKRHQMAVALAERTALRADAGLDVVTFDPLYNDEGKHKFEGSGVNVSEAASLSDKVDVFRTVRFAHSRILRHIRCLLLDRPERPKPAEIETAMEETRELLSHIIYINGDNREYLISGPLLYGTMLYQARLSGDATATLESLLASRPPRSMEDQIRSPDKLFKDSLDTAKIYVASTKDYPLSGEKSALVFKS